MTINQKDANFANRKMALQQLDIISPQDHKNLYKKTKPNAGNHLGK